MTPFNAKEAAGAHFDELCPGTDGHRWPPGGSMAARTCPACLATALQGARDGALADVCDLVASIAREPWEEGPFRTGVRAGLEELLYRIANPDRALPGGPEGAGVDVGSLGASTRTVETAPSTSADPRPAPAASPAPPLGVQEGGALRRNAVFEWDGVVHGLTVPRAYTLRDRIEAAILDAEAPPPDMLTGSTRSPDMSMKREIVDKCWDCGKRYHCPTHLPPCDGCKCLSDPAGPGAMTDDEANAAGGCWFRACDCECHRRAAPPKEEE